MCNSHIIEIMKKDKTINLMLLIIFIETIHLKIIIKYARTYKIIGGRGIESHSCISKIFFWVFFACCDFLSESYVGQIIFTS